MSEKDQAGADGGVCKSADESDELDAALRDFRLSVRGWSEAVYARPRSAVEPVRPRIWRLAAGWALGCALVAGGVFGGGVWEHRQQQMRIAAARVAEQQHLAVEERARLEEEDLLAKVDSYVSRQTPSAMEPLAQLMAEDEIR